MAHKKHPPILKHIQKPRSADRIQPPQHAPTERSPEIIAPQFWQPVGVGTPEQN